MAEKEGWLGSVGPFLYEDTDTDVYSDAAPLEGFRVAQGYIEDAPTETYHVAHKSYVDTYALTMRPKGFVPYAYSMHFGMASAYTDALSLPADGGCVAIPVALAGRMYLQSASFRSLSTADDHTIGWALYLDAYADTTARVAYSTADYTWTATAASNIGAAAASAPVLLEPGVYWLVLQNRHATNALSIGTFSGVSAFVGNLAQTKTATNPLGVGLTMITGPWTKITNIVAARLNGRVFGDSSAF
jgi:hypothetical protein